MVGLLIVGVVGGVYCVAVGVPAKPVKFKWTIDEILYHEEQLYPAEERYTREQLEKIFADVCEGYCTRTDCIFITNRSGRIKWIARYLH